MLEGKNAAELSNNMGTGSPNRAALPYIKPALRQNPALFPDDKRTANLEQLKELNKSQRRELSHIWTEIKTQD